MATFSASAELLERLCDPLTREPVRLASEAEVAALKAAIAAGRGRRRGGGEAPGAIEGAFLSDGGKRAYPIVDGLPYMLVDEAIELDAPITGEKR
jgi:uncharacterized protein YbaR (Trm112 family)